MLNAIPQIEGGARRRFGFRQVAATKTTGATRLVPFVFSKSQAYFVELGDAYARFYTDSGQIQQSGVPIELATPWSASQLFELEYTQNSDTMFIAHRHDQRRARVRGRHARCSVRVPGLGHRWAIHRILGAERLHVHVQLRRPTDLRRHAWRSL
ncbi:hypothetical protein [Burkholderia thailandensis]|nr:hypothetical protein [Burkholderia thailandensis]